MYEHHPRAAGRRHHRDPRHGPGNIPFPFSEILGRGRSGRQAIRRGEIRPLILALLTRKPMHGYEVIQELEAQSGGRWRPSAGSIYPTLQLLADEGLVTSEEVDGRRTYTLTDTGRAAAAAAPVRPRWDDDPVSEQEADLRQLVGAVMEVQRVGSPRARREAHRILADVRRQLYRLLADDESGRPSDAPSGAAFEGASDLTPDRA
jgi:DNA-binding PadR family transcriptional regulator